jgi:deoxycytidylate deaminase
MGGVMGGDLFSVVGKNGSTAKSDTVASIPKIRERVAEELVIGFVGPVGSGCTTVSKIVGDLLKSEYGYDCNFYKLSDYIVENAGLVGSAVPKDVKGPEKVTLLQTVGDLLREKVSISYLAGKAIETIAVRREKIGFEKSVEGKQVAKNLRQAHLIDSLKNVEEADLLRSTYGDMFLLIGVFGPKDVRVNRIEEAWKDLKVSKSKIEEIIERDYSEGEDHGQQVRDLFHQSDYFVRNDQFNQDRLQKELGRFFEILFAIPVHTPTVDESTMYVAYAEAARSACLSKKVGAAIISESAELLGLGRNDVPCFGGGLYSEDNINGDNRCYKWKGKECWPPAPMTPPMARRLLQYPCVEIFPLTCERKNY